MRRCRSVTPDGTRNHSSQVIWYSDFHTRNVVTVAGQRRIPTDFPTSPGHQPPIRLTANMIPPHTDMTHPPLRLGYWVDSRGRDNRHADFVRRRLQTLVVGDQRVNAKIGGNGQMQCVQ